MLRQKFWEEYARAQEHGDHMILKRVYEGVTVLSNWQRIVANPRRLAYILTEPLRDQHEKKSLLSLGWHKIRSIMFAEPGINNKTGLTDTKLMDTQIKIWQFLYEYEHGKSVQKIQQENKNTNLNVEINGDKAITAANTEEEMKKLLADIKARLAEVPMPPEPKIAISACTEPKLVLPMEQAHRDAKKAEVER